MAGRKLFDFSPSILLYNTAVDFECHGSFFWLLIIMHNTFQFHKQHMHLLLTFIQTFFIPLSFHPPSNHSRSIVNKSNRYTQKSPSRDQEKLQNLSASSDSVTRLPTFFALPQPRLEYQLWFNRMYSTIYSEQRVENNRCALNFYVYTRKS